MARFGDEALRPGNGGGFLGILSLSLRFRSFISRSRIGGGSTSLAAGKLATTVLSADPFGTDAVLKLFNGLSIAGLDAGGGGGFPRRRLLVGGLVGGIGVPASEACDCLRAAIRCASVVN